MRNPHKWAKLIFDNGAREGKPFQGGREAFSQTVLQLLHTYRLKKKERKEKKRNNFDLNLYTKIRTKWITYLNAK